MDVSKAFKNAGYVGKRIAVSIFLSSAVLAIANVDTVWQEQQHRSDYSEMREAARAVLKERLPAVHLESKSSGARSVSEPSMTEKLSAALAQDELGDQNPFANLSDLDPLNAIFAKGVVNFKRQAYRSPEYQEEAGYDLLEYEIEHRDHSRSTILAYLERPLIDSDRDLAKASKRLPIVLLMQANSGLSKQTLYRANLLTEQVDLTLSQAQALVSHKLNSGIPFISVSR
jgi:hypothetical protein